MAARNLFVVGLRLLGLWLLVWAVHNCAAHFPSLFYLFQAPVPPPMSRESIVIASVVPWLAEAVLGIGILLLAGRIADRFYPDVGPEAGRIEFGRVGAGDLYHVATFLMGVYLLVQAVPPAVRGAATMMELGYLAGTARGSDRWILDVVMAGIYCLFGIFLTFGARNIAKAMSSLRYDPDKVPSQQFTVRLLLLLAVALAVVLSLIRYAVVGGR